MLAQVHLNYQPPPKVRAGPARGKDQPGDDPRFRVCPQTVWPLAKEPAEELRLAGMLIEAAGGKVDWTAYPDQAAQEVKALIEAKLAGQAAEGPVPAPTILPLLEALKQSVGAQNGKETASPAKAKASRKRARRTA